MLMCTMTASCFTVNLMFVCVYMPHTGDAGLLRRWFLQNSYLLVLHACLLLLPAQLF